MPITFITYLFHFLILKDSVVMESYGMTMMLTIEAKELPKKEVTEKKKLTERRSIFTKKEAAGKTKKATTAKRKR